MKWLIVSIMSFHVTFNTSIGAIFSNKQSIAKFVKLSEKNCSFYTSLKKLYFLENNYAIL